MSRHVSDDENVDDSENNGQEENENNSIEVDDENEGSDAQQGGNNSDGDSDENEQDSGDEDANNKPGGKIQPKTSKRGRSSVGSRRAGRPKGRHKARDNRYRVYIFKILQQVHPKIGITKTGMDILNSFVEDMFEQICNEAMKLCSFNKTSTITAREISTAAKLSVNNNTIFGAEPIKFIIHTIKT